MYCITVVMIASSRLSEVSSAQTIGKIANSVTRAPRSQVSRSDRRRGTGLLLHHVGEADIEIGEQHEQEERDDRERARIAEVELAVGLLEGVERQHLRRASRPA